MQAFQKRYVGPVGDLGGMPGWQRDLLWARGIDTPEKAERFLHPDLSMLYDPFLMQAMDRTVQLIRMAIRRGDRILVYGDYDVDGISAVTVLLETLLEEGANASFRIPRRHSEGYGLNEAAVREIAAEYQMLITVDCGIANVREVRLAKELGMTVIVTDHHEIPETLPPADAVMDPLLGEYPFRRLCGAGVALKICQALQGMEGVEKRLEVAALATVADVVPLMDENRVIVREGMLRAEKTERPGLRALMENARVAHPLHSDDIAFRLAPRLNAAGRLEDAALGVELLMTRDASRAKEIADHLEANNRLRQQTEQKILGEAAQLFPGQVNLRQDRAVILAGEDWNTGLIGLAAGKLCERLHHPTVVLSLQGETAVGSCRSIPGVNIWRMLNLCGDLLVRFGGHEQAAGLTVERDRIPEFRKRLNEVILENCDEGCFLPVAEYDSEMSLADVTLETVEALETLEPTGCGNPAPAFLCRGAEVRESRRVGADRSHLKLTLSQGGAERGGIGFGLGDLAEPSPWRADVLFRPTRNEFGGRVSAQVQAQALRKAGPEGEENPEPSSGIFFTRCLQEMTGLAAKQREQAAGNVALRPEYLLKERLDASWAEKEQLGGFYRRMRAFAGGSLADLAAEAGVSQEQALFSLTVYEQLGLIRWSREPFSVAEVRQTGKRDLADSPLVRYVRGMEKTP